MEGNHQAEYYTRLRAHERRCVYGRGELPCAQGRPNRPPRIGYLGRRRRTSGFCKGRDRGKTLTSAKKKKARKNQQPNLQPPTTQQMTARGRLCGSGRHGAEPEMAGRCWCASTSGKKTDVTHNSVFLIELYSSNDGIQSSPHSCLFCVCAPICVCDEAGGTTD